MHTVNGYGTGIKFKKFKQLCTGIISRNCISMKTTRAIPCEEHPTESIKTHHICIWEVD